MMVKNEDRLEQVRRGMARRGFQVVVEDARIRFVGADEDAQQDILDAIECLKLDDSSALTELLEDMGLIPDLEGGYLTATVA